MAAILVFWSHQTNMCLFHITISGRTRFFFTHLMNIHHFLKHVMYDLIRSGQRKAKNKQKEALSP